MCRVSTLFNLGYAPVDFNLYSTIHPTKAHRFPLYRVLVTYLRVARVTQGVPKVFPVWIDSIVYRVHLCPMQGWVSLFWWLLLKYLKRNKQVIQSCVWIHYVSYSITPSIFLSYTFLVFFLNILFVFKHICFIFGKFTERFVWLLVSIKCVFLLILPVYN